MTHMQRWLETWKGKPLTRVKTTETYQRIKDFGLETVLWQEFNPKTPEESAAMTVTGKEFVERNQPCVFIYENAIKKDFLFNVKTWTEIQGWLGKNDQTAYSFLLTTQITNQGNGYVGSVFSDGKGRMIVETLHIPYVSNHRMLSQGREGVSEHWIDFLIVDEFERRRGTGKFLTAQEQRRLMHMYEDKEGYFEFVKGVQAGREGIFTTGYEKTIFPEDLFLALMINKRI